MQDVHQKTSCLNSARTMDKESALWCSRGAGGMQVNDSNRELCPACSLDTPLMILKMRDCWHFSMARPEAPVASREVG